MSNDRHANELSKSWAEDPRWAGIKRVYSAEDVVKLRGSVKIEYSLARMGAERFWKLLHEEKKWLNLTLDSGSLVITYGPNAAKVMAGRGIGVATAKRVLGKHKRDDTSLQTSVQQSNGDDLLKEVLEAERQYAKNRRFWRG